MQPNPRYALVTGGASGLGRALCLRLARDGWTVAVADRNEAGGRETLSLVEAAGGSGLAVSLDVADAAQWQALRERLQAEWPRLDLLINNAGVACAGEVAEMPLDDWRWIVDVNLLGVVHGCHTMLPWLQANPQAPHLVNVSSVAAFAAAPGMAAYNATKAGVLALSETLHAELRGRGVGVSVVCPGFFNTNLLESARFVSEQHRTSAATFMQTARMTADHVADATIRAVYRRRLYVIVPARARVLARFKRYFPRLLSRLIAWRYHAEFPGPD